MKLYLCVMENTQNNNIHKNQIFPLVNESDKTILLFLAPFFILTKKSFGINRQHYNDKKVHHIRIPLFSYNFSMNPFIFPWLLLFSIPFVIFFVLKYKIKEVHARNHLSAVTAVIIKKLFKNIKILSDFRGLYAEEGVILGRWKYDSLRFKFWKYIEKVICKNSDVVTTISHNMTQYISETYNVTNAHFVPAIVDTNKFYFSSHLREKFREENNILKDEVVFIYIGSFGLWHDVPNFYKYIEEYLTNFNIEKYRVYILSNINEKHHKNLHDKHKTIISSVQPNMVNKYLCGADIGILPGTEKEGREFDMMYKTMISSKLEEYLCTGLKVIVNQRIEEVCEMISMDFSEYPIIQDNLTREQISNKYQKIFSAKNIKELYKKLFSEGKI
ncbi:glycosyltransferase [Aliarcobacter butzleri]